MMTIVSAWAELNEGPPHPVGPSPIQQQGNTARMTGLEPATSGVTGRCSNQLSYIPEQANTVSASAISYYADSPRRVKSRSGRPVSPEVNLTPDPEKVKSATLELVPFRSVDRSQRRRITSVRDRNGLSRNLDDTGSPASTPVLVFQGISGGLGPEEGGLHQMSGRTNS